jgi:hypothetical protein
MAEKEGFKQNETDLYLSCYSTGQVIDRVKEMRLQPVSQLVAVDVTNKGLTLLVGNC